MANSLLNPVDPDASPPGASGGGIIGTLLNRLASGLEAVNPTGPIANPADQSSLREAALDPQGLDKAANLALGLGPGVIRAFHGTPHTFEPVEGNPFGEFQDQAIGSGEGAQAYGWGHYVAGNQKVAEGYQANLSEAKFNQLNNTENNQLSNFTKQSILKFGTDPKEIIENYRNLLADNNLQPEFERDLPLLEKMEKAGDYSTSAGHLLEVHILPGEDELLDWDRPWEQQSDSVKQGIERLGQFNDSNIAVRGRYAASLAADGSSFYQKFAQTLGSNSDAQQAASLALHEAGIPGIKYLDAGSRSTGEGTHNYVIFHPSNLRIIGRDGQLLTPIDHDPFASEAP